ncbi:MBL fold metallo-hydrolase [Pseudoxanthomonas sacheonensis]|uniref:Glyoxylase-like metal-dependent hydrolase (Beta-lactamase superfamily II) n=1 Tax=Pseudoxanthomonas sacheonensis TaxID=443615 RepID=A0ABU1RPF6_9GAMM|nr:MBL fold metallo-hydrolase [Pseudoxanthomonas sacheonensis]MDR6839795.1 glyoxylase-like metal-dependent hydrolase (beta-lactamase superfamily II) [Pseudoxanthomonas sacheonensis]
MRPTVHPSHHADTGTWSYVVADPATRMAAIIDPVLDFDAKSARIAGTSAQKLLDIVEQQAYDVRWLLETHAHADHLSAAQWLKQRLPAATLAIGTGIRTVQETFAPTLDPDGALATDGSQFDRLFGDDERFELGSLPARTIPVPGHTRDSLAYLIGDALFTGDSLFMPDAGTARCDFPGGDAATLYRSIRRLYDSLPDATRVFVCHDYGPGGREVACETTIGEQKRSNLHVRDGVDENAFVTLRKARDATLAMPALILPSLQVNLRGGALPEPEGNDVRYLRIPLDSL